ncbi:NAD-dependent epimerase/dehydratase family protein [Patescibacteria group bacterium]|nr:NAD-dependent epimerase/dehydratase family protein [Patescibacteria group bacterium]
MSRPKTKERILVTGGAGFIASHIVDAYVALGHKVIVLDNLSTGSRKNINPRANFYKADINDLPALERIFKKERPTVVNHHAAIAEVAKSLRNPIPTMTVNVLGTANLLLCTGAVNAKRFIFPSSGGTVYGEPAHLPTTEHMSLNPISPYGLSKLFGEQEIEFYSRMHGFTYLIFRYANVYGPRQNPKGEAGIMAIFSGLMKSNQRPTIFGDGSKTRDYLFVQDVVDANVRALTRGRNAIVNLGTGHQISDRAVFNTLAQEWGFTQKPIYTPFRKGEILRSALAHKKANEVLGWFPKFSLEKGIRTTVEWYQSH